jgi:hypothetical protein
MYYGMVKPLPIMLGKVPGKTDFSGKKEVQNVGSKSGNTL